MTLIKGDGMRFVLFEKFAERNSKLGMSDEQKLLHWIEGQAVGVVSPSLRGFRKLGRQLSRSWLNRSNHDRGPHLDRRFWRADAFVSARHDYKTRKDIVLPIEWRSKRFTIGMFHSIADCSSSERFPCVVCNLHRGRLRRKHRWPRQYYLHRAVVLLRQWSPINFQPWWFEFEVKGKVMLISLLRLPFYICHWLRWFADAWRKTRFIDRHLAFSHRPMVNRCLVIELDQQSAVRSSHTGLSVCLLLFSKKFQWLSITSPPHPLSSTKQIM